MTTRSELTEAEQQELFPFPPIEKPEWKKGMTTKQKFEVFHEKNPHVYDEVVRRAYLLKEAGQTRSNVQAIFTSMRNDFALHTTGDGGVKLSNSLSPWYVREIHKHEPELRSFFLKGKLKDEREDKKDAPRNKTFGLLAKDTRFLIPNDWSIYTATGLQFHEDTETGDMIQYNAKDETGALYFFSGSQKVKEIEDER